MVGPGKILVVDDDAGNREVLEELLRLRGYPVVTAASGPEALEVARKGAPFSSSSSKEPSATSPGTA